MRLTSPLPPHPLQLAERTDDTLLFPVVSRLSCAFASDAESDGEGFTAAASPGSPGSPLLAGGRGWAPAGHRPLVRASSDPSLGGEVKVSSREES